MVTNPVLDSIKKDIENAISKAKDYELNKENFVEAILTKFRFQPPFLDTRNASTRIDKFVTSPLNVAEINGSFKLGIPVEAAVINVKILGDRKFFEKKMFQEEKGFFVSNDMVNYKEVAEVISGDQEVLASIKRNALEKFTALEHLLKKFSLESEKFFEEDLPYFILREIKKEQQRRIDKQKDLDMLNPFL